MGAGPEGRSHLQTEKFQFTFPDPLARLFRHFAPGRADEDAVRLDRLRILLPPVPPVFLPADAALQFSSPYDPHGFQFLQPVRDGSFDRPDLLRRIPSVVDGVGIVAAFGILRRS